jgi:hypothetical protein
VLILAGAAVAGEWAFVVSGFLLMAATVGLIFPRARRLYRQAAGGAPAKTADKRPADLSMPYTRLPHADRPPGRGATQPRRPTYPLMGQGLASQTRPPVAGRQDPPSRPPRAGPGRRPAAGERAWPGPPITMMLPSLNDEMITTELTENQA